jgi:integral membrane protein
LSNGQQEDFFLLLVMNIRLRSLRLIGLTEGISFLVLLLIAMPLKYYFNIPMAVKIVGWAHGVLFMAYLVAVFLCYRIMKWNLFGFMVALGASLIPAGTFWLDKSWKKREQELKQTDTV